MSHLGDQLSALVDGELQGGELDRANAHLAACESCRAEAAGLRDLKRQLRALAENGADDELTRRLLAMAAPAGQAPSPRRRRHGPRRPRRVAHHEGGNRRPPRRGRRPRRRYLLLGAASLVVVGGIGAAAFTMGGSTPNPEPKVVPQVEMFSEQHALISGDVPFPDSTQTSATDPKP